MFNIQNNGQEIARTNYWKSEHAARGYYFLTINAGAIRLLVPDVQIHATTEMQTAKEVIVSRGPWSAQGKTDGIELLFEDHTDTPYCIQLMTEQCDRLPGPTDINQPWVFTAWSSAGKQLERPCYVRMVKQIPWMKPYKQKK